MLSTGLFRIVRHEIVAVELFSLVIGVHVLLSPKINCHLLPYIFRRKIRTEVALKRSELPAPWSVD
jgi:hypothetical protein